MDMGFINDVGDFEINAHMCFGDICIVNIFVYPLEIFKNDFYMEILHILFLGHYKKDFKKVFINFLTEYLQLNNIIE
jgi:hypothetical protein